MKKDRIISFWIFIFMLMCYLITMGGHFYTTDEEMHYRLIDSILLRQTLSVKMDPGEIWAQWYTMKGKDGNCYSKYGIGQSIAAIPLYLLGAGTSSLLRITGNDLTRLFVSLFNQFITAFMCTIMFLFNRKLGYSSRSSIFTALILGLCSIIWPYAKSFMNMPLASFLLFLSIFIIYSSKLKTNRHKIAIAGVIFGCSLLVRHDMFIFYPAFFLYFFLSEKSGRWKSLLLFSLGMSVVFPIILWYNFLRTGNLLTTGYPSEERFSNPILVGLLGLLTSSSKSIFIYSPPLLLSFVFLPGFFKKHKKEAVFVISVFIISLVFYSKWHNWEGGHSWGPRFMIPSMVLLTMSIAEFFENKQKWSRSFKSVAWGILIAGFIVQVLAITVNYFRYFYVLNSIEVTQVERSYYSFKLSPLFIQWMLAQKTFIYYGWKGLDFWFLNGPAHRYFLLIPLILILILSAVKLQDYIKVNN